VNRIPAGMRLKAGSTIVVPRSDDDDEDISADVAESAMLAVEPDVPDTRKMLIRVRRAQSMSTFADRYNVSISQVKSWNRTHRDSVMPGQLIVLHVPVGRAVPAEPGPVRVETVAASSRNRGGVTKIGTHVPESKGTARGGKAGAPAKVTRVTEKFSAPSKAVKSAAVKPEAVSKTTKSTKSTDKKKKQ
jgi:membrane-bound lytic murein transglycosylase D